MNPAVRPPTVDRLARLCNAAALCALVTNGARSSWPTVVPSPQYTLQVITVFLGSFIAGTFANQLDQFINNPSALMLRVYA